MAANVDYKTKPIKKGEKMNAHLSVFRLLLIGILSAALGFIMPVTARADAPDTTVVQVDETFTNDFDCSFPLIEQVKGSYLDRLYFDQNGVLMREYLSPQYQGALMVTWTNPANGMSLESHEASTIIVYYNPDGSFQKLLNQGLTFMVTVPGTGKPLLMDVGRIVVERGQGITFYAGNHQELIGDTASFCDFLAGS